MSSITLRQLEYLIAAAESGSVTAAAARLYLSQSAVSTALTDLESTLEVQIFIRHPRGLSLTNAGERVLTDSRRLVAGMDELRNSAREVNDALRGRLVVGCYSTLAPIVLPRIIAEFTSSHPGVDLSFIEGSHAQIESQLRDGSLDLAITYEYDFGQVKLAKDLTIKVMTSTPPYVILPENHALAERESLTLADLAEQPLILFDLPPGGEYFLSFFASEGLIPRILYRTTSFEMVRALVARGLGYSILSQRTQINMSYEGLRFVTKPFFEAPAALNVVAVHLNSVRLTRRAATFIEHCRTSLQATQ